MIRCSATSVAGKSVKPAAVVLTQAVRMLAVPNALRKRKKMALMIGDKVRRRRGNQETGRVRAVVQKPRSDNPESIRTRVIVEWEPNRSSTLDQENLCYVAG